MAAVTSLQKPAAGETVAISSIQSKIKKLFFFNVSNNFFLKSQINSRRLPQWQSPKPSWPNPSNHKPTLGFQIQVKLHSPPVLSCHIQSRKKTSRGLQHRQSMDTHTQQHSQGPALHLDFIKECTHFLLLSEIFRGSST